MVRLTPAASIDDGDGLLADIVDSLPTGLIYLGDGVGGVAVNRFAQRLLDLPPADLTLGLISNRLQLLGAPPRAVEMGRRTLNISCEFLVEKRHYAITSFRIEGPREHGVLWRIEDVTEARTVEAKLVEARRAALPSQVAGGAGHELNNLLARVICLAEEIQEDCGSPQVQERAETLIVTAERGAEVVRRLMTDAGSP